MLARGRAILKAHQRKLDQEAQRKLDQEDEKYEDTIRKEMEKFCKLHEQILKKKTSGYSDTHLIYFRTKCLEFLKSDDCVYILYAVKSLSREIAIEVFFDSLFV